MKQEDIDVLKEFMAPYTKGRYDTAAFYIRQDLSAKDGFLDVFRGDQCTRVALRYGKEYDIVNTTTRKEVTFGGR